MLPNTPLVSVRPYRYPHFQKQEIEIQVQKMLDVGFIIPNTSPFSYHVLLVKKKDDSKCSIWQQSIQYLGHVVS